MPQARDVAAAAAEVLLEPRSAGICAVYIVEARNRQEIREVKELFGGLDPEIEIRQLCEGTVISYAVRVPDGDTGVLDEIELALKEDYRFSISERSFQKSIYTVVGDLCEAAGGVLRPLAQCGICDEPHPFPTTVEFIDAAGRSLAMGSYCARCAASAGAADDREMIQRLLQADRTGLAPLGRLRLSDRPRRGQASAQFGIGREECPRLAVAG